MTFTPAHVRRLAQVRKWFAPARFGLFYHWGLFTGGGCTSSAERWQAPLKYPTPADLERAAPDPAAVAANLAENARRCGAKYATLTALHSCDGYCVIYPTQLAGVVHRTRLDYLGEFIRACAARDIKPLVYVPCGPEHWNTPGGPWLGEGLRDKASFARFLAGLVDELVARHGQRVGGFWIDGMTEETRPLPAHIHRVLPDAIVINNNNTFLDLDEVDYGTTEFLAGEPDPAYCRPSALRRSEPRFGVTQPGRDFNEDIPTCNQWWYAEGLAACSAATWASYERDRAPYLADPNFLVRQMLSSLGQRGQWNYALGVGPRVDGSLPPEFAPSFARLAEFLAWGGAAVYGTTGGEGSVLTPGWFSAPWSNSAGYCSVTVSLANPAIHYLLVTSAPNTPSAAFHTNGRVPARVTDLRTGAAVPFTMGAGVWLKDLDWSDVDRYGAKVFRLDFG